MKIFLLSVLAIGSVHAFTIGQTYRGETPFVQSYLRYYDNGGNERLVGYSYPQPQISFVTGASSSPVYKTFTQDEFNKACGEHFRIWSMQQYQALKCEIDGIRALGKEPSSDMLLKFQPLEKIAFTTDFSLIADLPEIKRLREEHLSMWKETHEQKVKSQNDSPLSIADINKAREDQLRLISEATLRLEEAGKEYKEIKSQTQQQQQQIVDTPEVIKAREEHLRLVNEAKLRVEQAKTQEWTHKPQHFGETKTEINLRQELKDSADNLKAREEHLRLVNEATLKIKAAEEQLKQLGGQQITQYQQLEQQQQQVIDTPEVMRAREEHLRLVNEAKLKAQQDSLFKTQDQHIHQSLAQQKQQIQYHEHSQDLKSQLPQQFQAQSQQQQVVDTPEVMRAREEHLRLVNEANLRAQSIGQQESKYKQESHDISLLKAQDQHVKQQLAQQHELQQQQVVDTPQVIKAREEHLRLVHEANLKAHRDPLFKAQDQHNHQSLAQQQQQFQYHYDHSQALKSQLPQQIQSQLQHVVDTPEVIKAREEHLRLVNEANLKAQSVSPQESQQHQQQVVDTPEVMRAREEHLRLVNEAKLKSQKDSLFKTQDQHTHQPLAQQQQQIHYHYEHSQDLKSQLPQQFQAQSQQLHQQQQVVDTPEVMRAREEHLRLVNEAKLKAQQDSLFKTQDQHTHQPLAQQQQQIQYNYEHSQDLKSQLPQQFQAQSQQLHQQQQVVDTPEVMRAREEHLRLVNEAKLKAQQDSVFKVQDQHIQQPLAQQQHYEYSQDLKSQLPQQIQFQQQQQVVDTPEVIRAREEHLRLINEANLRVQSVNPQESQQHQQQVVDTPEVMRAREEHLRLVNEAKLKAQKDSLFKTQDQQIYQPLAQQQQQIQYHEHSQDLKSQLPQQFQAQSQQLHQQQVVDTPEVMKAREEHLRLVSEANLRAHQVPLKTYDQHIQQPLAQQQHNEYSQDLKSQLPQQHQQQQILQQSFDNQQYIANTAEVQKAREEHLKMFNAIKLHTEQEGYGQISKPLSNEQQSDNIQEEERLREEKRILELENLKQTQQLQEDLKQLEFEDMREAERLDEEERQMNAELQRLKMEEEQQLSLEAKRLAEEQQQIEDELQRLKIEERQRLEQDRLEEAKHLKEEQEYLQTNLKYDSQNQQDYQKYFISQQNEFQPTTALQKPGNTYIPATKTIPQSLTQYQQFYEHNPFLKSTSTYSGNANNLQQTIFTNTPVFKTGIIGLPTYSTSTSNTVIPVIRYVQSAQQYTSGSQSANTDEALHALEKANNDHYRAHDLALERLRLAKLQNPQLNDCN